VRTATRVCWHVDPRAMRRSGWSVQAPSRTLRAQGEGFLGGDLDQGAETTCCADALRVSTSATDAFPGQMMRLPSHMINPSVS
jgi:hypothetical protein